VIGGRRVMMSRKVESSFEVSNREGRDLVRRMRSESDSDRDLGDCEKM
jgi:hypothetical protein